MSELSHTFDSQILTGRQIICSAVSCDQNSDISEGQVLSEGSLLVGPFGTQDLCILQVRKKLFRILFGDWPFVSALS